MMTSWEVFAKFVAAQKPAIESFFVGWITAALVAVYAYLTGSDPFSWRTLVAILVGSLLNYITSKSRRTEAKQLKAQVAADRVQHFAAPDASAKPQP